VGFFATKRVFFENLCSSSKQLTFSSSSDKKFSPTALYQILFMSEKDPIKRHIRGKHIWVVQVKWSAAGLVSLPAVELRRQWPQVATK